MADVVPLTEPRDSGRAEPLTLAHWTAGVINRWRTIFLSAMAVLGLALLAAVVLRPVYRVTVSFAPNATSSSKLSGAMSSLGGLSSLAGGLGGLGASMEPTESPAFYTELLQSRELLTRLLLTRFADPRSAHARDSARLVDIMDLKPTDPERRLELGVKALQKTTRTESDVKSNLVKLTVDETYPELAAREANVMLSLVNAFNLQQRASRAGAKRAYLQGRMAAAKNALTVAQERYRDFLSGNRQWRSSPTLSSDEETLHRDQDVASELYLSLEKQYEAARLDEFNDAALITIVDSAVAPVRPYWPRYSLLVPGAILFGLFVGVMVAGVSTVYADWSRRDPTAASELAAALRRSENVTNKPAVPRRA